MTCNTVANSNRNYIDVKIFSECANKYADCLSSKWTASARAIPYCNWRVVLIELLFICAWRSFDLAGAMSFWRNAQQCINLLVVFFN